MVSIVIPVHNMENKDFFLTRCLNSIKEQTYTDYEIVIADDLKPGASANTNEGIKLAKGDIIKVLHMDDFFAHPGALQKIVDNFTGGWLVTGCIHTHGQDRFNGHLPRWNNDIKTGNNTIGGPSVLAFENKKPLFFNEDLVWLFDCDYYVRLYERYGKPTILNDINVVIGVGPHQMTEKIPEEVKNKEMYGSI